jgi:membrane fusion protein (multidrug efflux system)
MNKNLLSPPRLLAALFLLAGLIACGKREAAAGNSGAAAAPPVKLSAVVLNAAAVSSGITTTGTVMAERGVELKTEISGRVIRIGFNEGGSVSTGQILIKLDDAELRAQLEKARAHVLLAQTQEKRLKEQVDAQAVSQRDYDAARADLQTAQAEADLAKAQLDKTEVRAPFGGSAGLRQVDLGAVLQPGTVVTMLQDLHSFRIEFSIPEDQASGVHAGMPVRFTVAGREDTLSASVFAVEPGVNPETRLLKMRARCASPKGGLRPGAFARVELPLHENSALWVPAQAVVEGARGTQVWRVREGRAGLTVFQPGTRTPEAVEAKQGLSAGDTILISGLMQLKPGASVNPSVVP